MLFKATQIASVTQLIKAVDGYLLCHGGHELVFYSASSLHQSPYNLAAVAKVPYFVYFTIKLSYSEFTLIFS